MNILPISAFCNTGSGGTPSRSKRRDYYENGDIPWIKSGELSKETIESAEEYITEKGIAESSAKLLTPGAILIAMYGATVGQISRLRIQAATNQAICHVYPDANVCDAEYLYRVLKGAKEKLLAKRVGGGQPNISQKIIRALPIPLPPLAEQKRIAAILDAADALRAKRRESLAQLDALLQSTFLDLFGDPVTNPKGWERKSLGEFIRFVGGSQPPKTTFVYEPKEGYVRLVQIRDFKTDKYQTYIPKELAKRPFSEDDVMIARYGPPVFQILTGMSGSYNVALMKAEPIGQVDKRFIFHLLNLPIVNAAVVAQSERTAGQSGVNLQFLNNYTAHLPPYSLQTHFGLIVETIERQKTRLRAHLAELDTLFASLQSRAFNGEL